MGALFLFMSLTNKPQWVAAYTSPRAEKMVTDRIAADLHLETICRSTVFCVSGPTE